MRRTVPKIEEVYTDNAMRDHLLSAEPLNGTLGTSATHFSPCSATARTFSGGYAA